MSLKSEGMEGTLYYILVSKIWMFEQMQKNKLKFCKENPLF